MGLVQHIFDRCEKQDTAHEREGCQLYGPILVPEKPETDRGPQKAGEGNGCSK